MVSLASRLGHPLPVNRLQVKQTPDAGTFASRMTPAFWTENARMRQVILCLCWALLSLESACNCGGRQAACWHVLAPVLEVIYGTKPRRTMQAHSRTVGLCRRSKTSGGQSRSLDPCVVDTAEGHGCYQQEDAGRSVNTHAESVWLRVRLLEFGADSHANP